MPEISGVPPELVLAKLQRLTVRVGYLKFRNFPDPRRKIPWSVQENSFDLFKKSSLISSGKFLDLLT